MTITRGYSFGLTEAIASDSLYNLVAGARFTNVNWLAAISPNISVVGASAPSLAGNGAIWWQYEQLKTLTVSTYTGLCSFFEIMLWTPQGDVALFRENALETRLFCNMDNTGTPGTVAFCQNVAAQTGTTLAMRLAWGASGEPFTSPQFGWFGANWQGTASSGVSNNHPRVTLLGLSIVDIQAANTAPTTAIPTYLALSKTGGHASFFASSAVTSGNILASGLALENKPVAAYSFGWLFGSPVMRNQ